MDVSHTVHRDGSDDVLIFFVQDLSNVSCCHCMVSLSTPIGMMLPGNYFTFSHEISHGVQEACVFGLDGFGSLVDALRKIALQGVYGENQANTLRHNSCTITNTQNYRAPH